MNGRRKNITMTFPQRVKALEVLKEFCGVEGEFAVYRDGHTAASIAALVTERCGFPCSSGGINGLRAQNIGKIRVSTWGRPNGEATLALEERITELERRVAALEEGRFL